MVLMQDLAGDEDGVCAVITGVVNGVATLIGGGIDSDGIVALAAGSGKQQEEIDRH